MNSKAFALSVVAGKISDGSQIHLWKHRLDDSGQWWIINSDNTLSPELVPNLVIGWQGKNLPPQLVERGSPQAAVFDQSVSDTMRKIQ